MYVLVAEESRNQDNIKALQPPVTSSSTANIANVSTVTASDASTSNVAQMFPATYQDKLHHQEKVKMIPDF